MRLKPNEPLVLHEDGTWMYHLGFNTGGGTPAADEQPMTALGNGWWATDHQAATITVTTSVPSKSNGYRLRYPELANVSRQYPATLTDEEWESHADSNDGVCALYDQVYEDQPPKITVLNVGDWLRLDGNLPPEDDDRMWVAGLGTALQRRPEYHHLFPGHLTGLQKVVEELARQHPRVASAYLDSKGQPAIKVRLELPFNPPVTVFQPAWNANGTLSKRGKGAKVPSTVSRTLILRVHDRVAGANRAQAADLWDALIAEFTEILDTTDVTACTTCKGHGYVATGSEQYGTGIFE